MNQNHSKDDLYSQPIEKISDFVFDDAVATVFEDMIQRSVPGYKAIITMTGVLAEQYTPEEESRCYDLGCSLGAATAAMAASINRSNNTIVAVDNSSAMIEKCCANLESISTQSKIEIMCADIRDIEIKDASIVVMNFTLQFVSPAKREDLLRKIYSGMKPGGVLILSDKIDFEDKQEKEVQTELHHAFKRLNGYSDLEISQKRSALENVLLPDSLKVHKHRLTSVGFQNINVWFQCFNFASLIAIK